MSDELNRLADRVELLSVGDWQCDHAERDAIAKGLRALSARAEVPEGYTMVRESMLRHWLREMNGIHNGDINPEDTAAHVHASISAMLAAAPQPATIQSGSFQALLKAVSEAQERSCKSGGFNHIDEVTPWILRRYDELQACAPKPAGDWPEDATHENGNYQCVCVTCGKTFVGHKRRVVCKSCSVDPKPAGEDDRVAERIHALEHSYNGDPYHDGQVRHMIAFLKAAHPSPPEPAPSAPAGSSLVIEPTHCTCHPETCCHGDYTLRIGDTKITDGSKDQLCMIVSELGRLSSPAAVKNCLTTADVEDERWPGTPCAGIGCQAWPMCAECDDGDCALAFAFRCSGAQQVGDGKGGDHA